MRLRVKNLSISVGTTATQIVGANPRRVWLCFVNKGANRITLSLIHPETGLSTGEICLYERGAAVFSVQGDMPWPGGITGVAELAATDLAGVEVEVV